MDSISMSSEKLKYKKMEPIYVKSVSQKGFTSMGNNSKKGLKYQR